MISILSELSVQQMIAICSSIAAAVVALVRFHSMRHADRIDAFRANYDRVSRSRFIYSNEALKTYYEHEKRCSERSTENSLYLIAKDSWIGVMDLDKVVVSRRNERYKDSTQFKTMGAALLPDSRKTYSQNIRKYIGAPIFNAEVIAMLDAEPVKGGMRIEAYETRYFDYLDHLGLREMYIAKLLEDGFRDDDSKNEKRMDRLFCKLPMMDLKNRPASIGACALCIFTNIKRTALDKDEGKSYLLIHRRTGAVAEARNTMSMVPAGSLTWDDDPSENGISHDEQYNKAFFSTIVREFEEEVLGCSEVEWSDIYTKPSILTDGNVIQYKSLGMGLDPLSAKVEQMSLIVIDGEKAGNGFKSYIAQKRIIELDSCDFLTLSDIDGIIRNGSSEGSIHICKVNYENLLRLMLSKESMPVFREAIHQILRVDNRELRKMIGLDDYDEDGFSTVEKKIKDRIRPKEPRNGYAEAS